MKNFLVSFLVGLFFSSLVLLLGPKWYPFAIGMFGQTFGIFVVKGIKEFKSEIKQLKESK